MSDTGEPAAAAVEPVVSPSVNMPEQPVVVTEVDIPVDGGFPAPDPEPTPEPAAAAPEEPKPDAPKPIKKSPFQIRIDTLTKKAAEAERVAEEQRQQAELYKAMAEGRAPAESESPAQPQGLIPGSPEFKKAVQAEAAQMAAQQAAQARTQGIMKAGASAYPDFNDRCNVVADLGAGDRPDFMQIVTDPEVIPDGHKIIAQLAENPEEAARILALPTVQMTAALVKFQAEINKAPAPRPISSAPAPIRPIDGVARASEEPNESDSMAEYARKYKALQDKRRKEGQPGRFAKH